MAKTTNPLVEVDFIDRSNYVYPEATDDIVGVVIDADWGVPETFRTLDRQAWEQFHDPLSLEAGNYSQAVVQRLFETGASYIEAFRIASKEQYKYIFGQTAPEPTKGETAAPFVLEQANVEYTTVKQSGDPDMTPTAGQEVLFVMRQRCPRGFGGTVRFTQVPLTKTQKIAELGTKIPLYKMEYFLEQLDEAGNPPEGASAVETFQIAFTRVEVMGESFYYKDVLNAQSRFWMVPDNVESLVADLAVDATGTPEVSIKFDALAKGNYTLDDYSKAYAQFMDRDQSQCTLLVSTVDPNANAADYASFLQTIIEVANTRKDCVALIGGPRATLFGQLEDEDNKAAQEKYFADILTSDMFDSQLAATERYTYKNKVYNLDGTATNAGRIAAVAAQFGNRNRLPSYKDTGYVNSVLNRSLKFDTVVALHDNDGIGAIYATSQGNYIFNISTGYALRTSYFANLNVMRVTAALLKWLLSDVELTIHQDTVGNEVELLRFQDRCNQKLQQMVSRNELKADSVIKCGPEINTDELSMGGTCLNIECYLYYINLVKRVKIKIIASDSTTSVSISQE